MKDNSIVVTLGVTGSIAVYKSVDLVRQLVTAGIDVRVIMTEAAQKLVSKETFKTMSRNDVITDLWNVNEWKPKHVSLAEITDMFVVAPCTANFMGKVTAGIADDALTTFAITYSGKTLLAPAMNAGMWKNPIVRRNYKTLAQMGIAFIGPETGTLACGTEGQGKLSSVEDIFTKVITLLNI